MLNNELLLNIMFHVIILFTILSIFYMTVITKLSTKILNDEISHSINTISKNNQNYFDAYKESLLYELHKDSINANIEKYNTPDKFRENNNRWLFSLMIVLITIGWIFVSTVSYLIPVNKKEIIIENIITFTFIGVVEIMFFLKIASQFSPVLPSVISTEFINNLSN